MKAIAGFRSPLGLALAGGGALGSWQAGVLSALTEGGLSFDKVLGFSAGALTGAAYFLGREEELLSRWRAIDSHRILRFSPRLSPLSLFSGESVWEAVRHASDEESAKRAGRCDFLVVSLRDDGLPVYSRFSPGGARGWDGPLDARLVASCAIPVIFPPVRIEEAAGPRLYRDGGIPGREPLSFADFAGCRDLVVVEMVRPEEPGPSAWGPIARREQKARVSVREHMNRGVLSLAGLPEPPRVFRLSPSKVLDFTMLCFRERHCGPALELGLADGRGFLMSLAENC